ncbi:MAG TPA: hypothetical protein PK228_05100 [Saprospiraceae bacterium]|nr:hypothetical protein [Saprospiraceae bacterium]
MSKTLSFFSTRSAESLSLAEMLRQCADDFGYAFYHFSPETANSSTFFEASINSEIVIMDATIEPDVENDHYAIFNLMHIAFDHIWIVSRSYLPVNFTTMFRDIAPLYPFPASHPSQLANLPKITPWNNSDILRRVAERLPAFEGRMPLASQLPPLDYNNPTEFYKAYTELMTASIKKDAEERRKGAKKVFISYRSSNYEQVQRLQEDYKGQYEFIVMPPGSLAYETEVLPRLRRWQLMSVLDRQIDLADEFWVYATDDYDQSWWTQGELITLAYRKFSNTYCPEIKTYHPSEDRLSLGYEKLPVLTQAQTERIARRYSNSDPLTMGPENVANIRKMRRLSETPLIGSVFHWFVRKITESKRTKDLMNTYYPTSVLSNGEITEDELLQKIGDKEYFRKYLYDPVWEPAFWENAVLEYGKKEDKKEQIDVDMFIDMTGLEYVELSPAELEQYVRSGRFVHGGIGYTVLSAAPRFLWIPNRMGKQPKDNLQPWSVNLFVKDTIRN